MLTTLEAYPNVDVGVAVGVGDDVSWVALGYTAPRGGVMRGGVKHRALVALGCVLVALELSGCGGIIREQADRH